MTIAVKICGLKTSEAVDAAVTGGATYAGFVFFAKSPRSVAPDTAQALRNRLPDHVKAVALVVDPPDETLRVIIKMANPDLIQLHGRETPARVAEIRTRFGLPVIKALPVAKADDLRVALDYAADMILFDAMPAPNDTRPGGNARAFDWRILREVALPSPFILAGGLTPENLSDAVRISGAKTVDVSSGVESAPGEKDLSLIKAFLSAAKAL